MKRIGALLVALLLVVSPFCYTAAETSFTGQVTYKSGKTVYLQDGREGKLVYLDSSNDPALVEAIHTKKVVKVTGTAMIYKQGGYRIPEITDAMIVSISDSGASATTVSATLSQLDDDLMAVKVKVKATKAEFLAANIQFLHPLDEFEDDQPLVVTGVLSANKNGRIILSDPKPAATPTPAPTPTPTSLPTPTPPEPPADQASNVAPRPARPAPPPPPAATFPTDAPPPP